MARRRSRRALALRLAVHFALGAGILGASVWTSAAQTTAVVGSATDYVAEVSLFGGPAAQRGPAGTPGCDPDQRLSGPPGMEACNISVTLPPTGGSESVSDPDSRAVARYGPGIIFSRSAATVRTQGTGGPTGSVTSSAELHDIDATGREIFTAASLSSTCTASESGVSGSTTIAGGTLQTSEGNPDLPGDEVVVDLPGNPPVGTTYPGAIETVGDTFEYRFNEQIPNPDGSLTVYAAHLVLLGPTAVGHVYIGRVDCGVGANHTTTSVGGTTTTSRPDATTTTTTAPDSSSSDRYGPAEWWPLRKTHVVGCTNMNGCGDGYHGYWALDIDAARGDEVYADGPGQVTLAVDDQGGNCDLGLSRRTPLPGRQSGQPGRDHARPKGGRHDPLPPLHACLREDRGLGRPEHAPRDGGRLRVGRPWLRAPALRETGTASKRFDPRRRPRPAEGVPWRTVDVVPRGAREDVVVAGDGLQVQGPVRRNGLRPEGVRTRGACA